MRKLFILLSLILIISLGCKKNDTPGCWKCVDASGNYLQDVCGENEQDAFDKSGIIGGVHDINVFRQYCHKK
jgi:hypothetical protein